MSGKVETYLQQLSSLAKCLNEASDELSKQIIAIESALNGLKLGIWAWARVPVLTETELAEPDEKGQRLQLDFDYNLGYGKHNGKWGLLISYGWDPSEEQEITFLRDAARPVRVKAIDRVPELLDALTQQMSLITQETSQRASEAKEIAAALKNTKSR